MSRVKRQVINWAFLVTVLASAVALTAGTVPALAAYRAHGDDQDVAKFLAAFPQAVGGKLDDCYLCHGGGQVGKKTLGRCDYCHQTYGLREPHGPIPLNPFGDAYLAAGRGQEFFATLAQADRDGDGFSDAREVSSGTWPGDPADHPGMAQAPTVTLGTADLAKLPQVEEFLLMNTTKSGDFYATYKGVRLADLLAAADLAPEAESISVFAPDGFSTDFSLEEVQKTSPQGQYFANVPWVSYPAGGPTYPDQAQLPGDLSILLAWERDGQPLVPGRLEYQPQDNRWTLEGEGPYRLVTPQKVPSPPDRPSTDPDLKPSDPPYPFDEAADHNAGAAVRSVVAIRVNPLPPGTTDFNWREGGWSLVDKGQVVLYGAIKSLATAPAPAPAPSSVFLNGRALNLGGVAPRTVAGELLVPVRAVAEAAGATVAWREADRTCQVVAAGGTALLAPGQDQARANGAAVTLLVAPTIIQDRLLVPLGWLAPFLGFDLERRDGGFYLTPRGAAGPPAAGALDSEGHGPELSGTLTVFHAGSLDKPLQEAATAFQKLHPEVQFQRKGGGSVAMVKLVTEQGQPADLVASADYQVFDQLMLPQHADWYVMFAQNKLVLAYRPEAPGHEEINRDNWFEILGRPGVRYGHTNPDLDPAGYRALMVWQLAEKHYQKPGLYEQLEDGRPPERIYDSAAAMVQALKEGQLDYAFEYVSVAQQNGLPYLELPEATDLSSPRYAADYAQARVETKGSDGPVIQVGSPIVYGLTIPKNAPHPDLALEFVKFLLGPEGQAIMAATGQVPIVPAQASDLQQIPDALRDLVK